MTGATRQTNLEDVMLSEVSRLQKKKKKTTNIVSVHLHEVSGIVKFIEAETRMVVAGGWDRGTGS